MGIVFADPEPAKWSGLMRIRIRYSAERSVIFSIFKDKGADTQYIEIK